MNRKGEGEDGMGVNGKGSGVPPPLQSNFDHSPNTFKNLAP